MVNDNYVADFTISFNNLCSHNTMQPDLTQSSFWKGLLEKIMPEWNFQTVTEITNFCFTKHKMFL